ncbi:MAG: sulfotransferase [Bacteroidetes bacterium]|nr:sulfotransferase [Bacteroidota bacterium]
MKHSYILAGTVLRTLLKLLFKFGVSMKPGRILRALFLVQNGIWAALFKRMERGRYGHLLEKFPVPDDPVIIIGHWRTGTTFLHQLMNLDPNLAAPTVFQVSIPDSFLVSKKYYQPIMTAMISSVRPMDNVKLGIDEPQEDEYALYKLTLDSPLNDLIFPKTNKYFLKRFENFDPADKAAWQKAIKEFCRKLAFESKKRIVMKNPFHSMRILLLRETFPNARFVHIHRHPYKVVPSTINMWNIVGTQNILKGKWVKPNVEDVSVVLDRMLDKIRTDLAILPSEVYCEVNFDDLDTDPVNELKKVYKAVGLEYTQEFESNVRQFLHDLGDYKKNTYVLTEDEKELIRTRLASHFYHYKYAR